MRVDGIPTQRLSDNLMTGWSRFPRTRYWETGDACTWPAEVSGRRRHSWSAVPWWLEEKGERGAVPVAVFGHVVGEDGGMDGDRSRGGVFFSVVGACCCS